MTNPFVYGEIVPASSFVDREDELDRLTRDLLAGQKVFLISPRRYGKSSLIQQALKAAGRGGALVVDLTVSSYSSYVGFLEGYARALSGIERQTGRAVSWLREALAPVRPEVRIESSPAGKPGLAVTFPAARTEREVARLAQEVFALPGRIAEARGRKLAIALDEFQAINAFNGGSVEHALRAAVQVQRSVGYVFAGSEPSLMEKMIGPRRPFYKAGPVLRLNKISHTLFADFIDRRFTKTGIRPEPGLADAIIDLAGNLPYDVQRLAHETWDDVRSKGSRKATLEDLHGTLARLLSEQETIFEALWQRLTLHQRATLRGVVLQAGREIHSADARERHRLGAASSIQKSLAALTDQDVLVKEGSRYLVVDSLLREWVARRTF